MSNQRYLVKVPCDEDEGMWIFCLEMRGHQAHDVRRYTGLAGQRDVDSYSNHAGKLSRQIIQGKSE